MSKTRRHHVRRFQLRFSMIVDPILLAKIGFGPSIGRLKTLLLSKSSYSSGSFVFFLGGGNLVRPFFYEPSGSLLNLNLLLDNEFI